MSIASVSILQGPQSAAPIGSSKVKAKNRIVFNDLKTDSKPENRFAVAGEVVDTSKRSGFFESINDSLPNWRTCYLTVRMGDSEDTARIKVNKNSLCKRLGISKDVLDEAYKIGGQKLASDLVNARIQVLNKESSELSKHHPQFDFKHVQQLIDLLLEQARKSRSHFDYEKFDELMKIIDPEDAVLAMLNNPDKENINLLKNNTLTEEYKEKLNKLKKLIKRDTIDSGFINHRIISSETELNTINPNSYEIIKNLIEAEKTYSRHYWTNISISNPKDHDHATAMIKQRLANKVNSSTIQVSPTPLVRIMEERTEALKLSSSPGTQKNRVNFIPDIKGENSSRFYIAGEVIDHFKTNLFNQSMSSLPNIRTCYLSVKTDNESLPIIIKVNKNSLCKRLGISKDELDKAYEIGGKHGIVVASQFVESRIAYLKNKREDLNSLYTSNNAIKTLSEEADYLLSDKANYNRSDSPDYVRLERLINQLNPDDTVLAMLTPEAKENLNSAKDELKETLTKLINSKEEFSKNRQRTIARLTKTAGLSTYEIIKNLTEAEKIYSRLPLKTKLVWKFEPKAPQFEEKFSSIRKLFSPLV